MKVKKLSEDIYKAWKDALSDPSFNCLSDSYKNDICFRVFKYSEFNKNTECVEWVGARNSDGYGYFYFNKHQWRIHRLSWTIFNKKKIPKKWPYAISATTANAITQIICLLELYRRITKIGQ